MNLQVTATDDVTDTVEVSRVVWTDPRAVWRRRILFDAFCYWCHESETSTDRDAVVRWAHDHACHRRAS